MSFFKGAMKALVPKIELPKYFKITSSVVEGGATQIEAKFLDKHYVKTVPTSAPTVIDVLRAFPDLNLSKVPKAGLAALEYVILPSRWDLECNPAQTKEGFRITLDIHQSSGTKHWEKELQVTAVQLAEFVDVLDWVKQANRMEKSNENR